MAEYPSDKPTQDVTWATAPADPGDVVEMDAGKKLAGFTFKATIPYEEENWQRNAYGTYLHWLSGLAVRQFDSLYDALYTSADELRGNQFETFILRAQAGRARSGSPIQQAGAGTGIIRCVCTDGGRIYYVQGGVLCSAKNIHSTSANGLATRTPAGGLNARNMACDGRAIIIANTNTLAPPVTVINTTDKTLPVLYEGVGSGSVDACCADSTANQARVWWGTQAGGGTDTVEFWGSVDGLVSALTSLQPVRALCATQDFLFVGTGDSTNALLKKYEKDAGGDDFALNHIADISNPAIVQTRAQALCTDGEFVFWLIDGDGSNAPTTRAVNIYDGTALWTVTHAANIGYGIGLGICCDDRYVYVPWFASGSHGVMALDKATGAKRAMLLQGTDMMTPCTDGVQVMTASATSLEGIFRQHTGRQPGHWMAQSGEDDGRRPFKNLAIPLGSR